MLRLRELVVIDTQWIVDGISRIIRDFEIHKFDVDKEAVRIAGEHFRELERNGVLYHDLLQHLWSEPKFAKMQARLAELQQITPGIPAALHNARALSVPAARSELTMPATAGGAARVDGVLWLRGPCASQART